MKVIVKQLLILSLLTLTTICLLFYGSAISSACSFSDEGKEPISHFTPTSNGKDFGRKNNADGAYSSITPTNPASKSRRDLIIDSDLPYKCGVLLFYHIPSTGGSTINTWLSKYSVEKGGNYSYFTHWVADYRTGRGFIKSPKPSENRFINGMTKHVQNITKNEWRIAHAHINSIHLNESESLLYEWRSTVEAQGCHLINNIVMRDPLSHTLSLFKVIQRKNSSQADWAQHLSTNTDRGLWSTQLDFFLYNRGRRNPYNVSKEQKVRRAFELLQRHFDIVVVGDHSAFMEKVLKMTGWNFLEMKRRNSYKKELIFTKKEVELLQKRIQANGDVDFIDAAKIYYHDYLSSIDGYSRQK